MRIDKTIERLERLFDNPNDPTTLKRIARDLAYELPRNDLEKLRKFRFEVLSSRIYADTTDKTAFARGLLEGLLQLCSYYADCIDAEAKRRLTTELSKDVCPEFRDNFQFGLGFNSVLFSKSTRHTKECPTCESVLKRYMAGHKPLTSFLTRDDNRENLL